MRPYSSAALALAVQLENPGRGSIAAAKSVIYRRDLYLFDVHAAGVNEDYHDDEYANYLRDLNRAPHRFEQRENDAFRNGAIARTLTMLPPSISDERWMPRAVAFAVSMLVFLFNMHWWSHVGVVSRKVVQRPPASAAMDFHEVVSCGRLVRTTALRSNVEHHLSSLTASIAR